MKKKRRWAIPTNQELVELVDAHCEKHRIGETRVGRDIGGDPNLVREMRAGRDLRLSTVRALFAYMGLTA